MKKRDFYKKQLVEAYEDDGCVFTPEIREISTGKIGVANATTKKCEEVSCFYGNEDGSDDCIISFEEFLTRFVIERVIDKKENAYTVTVNGEEYALVKEK